MIKAEGDDKYRSLKLKKRRAVRQNSNVFAMFDQKQIAEFKEAFSMIDHDNDGFIDKEDLKDMLASLGQNAMDEEIDAMINEAPGSINFTMFLTLMGEKMSGTDPEHEIIQAFQCFDENNVGYIHTDTLREYLTTMGDRLNNEEVDIMYKGVHLEKDGNFRYHDFVRVLKHGE
jgi:Ca2+-binding EF-hand superfamily protein